MHFFLKSITIKEVHLFSTNSKKYKLFNEDNLSFMKKLPDSSIDLILTDPPYNLAPFSRGNIHLKNGKTIHNDIASWDNVPLIPQNYVEPFKRILKPTGNIFIFTSYSLLGQWYDAFNPVFSTFQIFVWHKTTPTDSVYKNSFLNSCELVICLWNKGHTWNFTTQSQMHNFFECPSCTYPEKLSSPKHPTQKPLALIEHLLMIASNPNDIVFDPFMGVATTGEAALKNNRRFIGTDINEIYVKGSLKRLAKY